MVILVVDVNIVSRIKKINKKKKLCFESLVSGCISSPCLNNGQCISLTTNCSSTTCAASCRCLTGTIGTYCEQQDSSCLTFPCFNGGTCSMNPINNTYYCQCPPNIMGVR